MRTTRASAMPIAAHPDPACGGRAAEERARAVVAMRCVLPDTDLCVGAPPA